MRYAPYILLAIYCTGLWSCSSTKKSTSNAKQAYITMPSGIKYRIVDDKPGNRYVKEGDYIELFIKTYFNDSLIFDSRQQSGGLPVAFPAGKPQFNGDLTESFYLLTPGDSAVFLVPVDTLKANKQNLQPWMIPGNDILYAIKMVGIKTQAELNAEKEKKAKEMGDPNKDDEELVKYFRKNNITAEKRPSGLYYVIHKPTDGDKPLSGKTVKVNYTGRLMNGTEFDSNKGKEPYSFVLGRGQVILGWDEGIALLKKGEKATLYVPSRLAYGNNSPSPKVPAGSILIFDVELVDF